MKIMKYPPILFTGVTTVGPLDESFEYPLTFAAEDLLPTDVKKDKVKKGEGRFTLANGEGTFAEELAEAVDTIVL